MNTQQHQPQNLNNQIMFNFVSKMQETIAMLDKEGLTVLNIDVKGRKPVVVIEANKITEKWEKEHKAIPYIKMGRDFHQVQMQLNDCVIVWRKYLV
ncbi:hypothetical protein [Phocoenobacter skyensis]|uniref:Uncharacterized protein n=1 Tax=Phocoenobacter skyensis TaxID=97481 RepID=A0ABT9JKT1_9PAST|nr:hypothetical protein [Pasteurella skyensis]MDP8079545.1 hypothetical protein [Pasteurella skyensis]MDP8085417.1 hypothetical protein [Pasteurella skyensis]